MTAVATTTAAASAAFVKGVSDIASYGDNIDKMSQKIGISAEAYQEWAAVFEHSGTSIDTLQMGMKTLRTAMDALGESSGDAVVDQEKLAKAETTYNNALLDVEKAEIDYQEAIKKSGIASASAQKALINLQKAQNKVEDATSALQKAQEGERKQLSDSAAALIQLGISAVDAEGSLRDEEEVFSEVITALQNMENETERARLASILLGRSGTELGALLNTSAEETQAMKDRVHELGGVMSDEAVKSAAAFQDTLQDLRTAASGVKNNLLSQFLPAVSDVMGGVTEILSGNADEGIEIVSNALSDLLTNITSRLPEFLNMASRLVRNMAKTLIANAPQLISTGSEIVMSLIEGLIEMFPEIVSMAIDIVNTISSGIIEALPDLIPAITQMVVDIAKTLTDPGNIGMIIDSAIGIIMGLADGLIAALPILLDSLPQIIMNLADGILQSIPKIIEAGTQLFQKLLSDENIDTIIDFIIFQIPQIIFSLVKALWDAHPQIMQAGYDLIVSLVKRIPEINAKCREAVANVIRNVIDKIKSFFTDFNSVGKDMINGLWNGIKERFSIITDGVKNLFSGVVDGVKNLLGIHSPSRVFAGIGENMAAGLGKGWDDEFDKIKRGINSDMAFESPEMSFADSALGKSSAGIVNGIIQAGDAGASNNPIVIQLVLPSKEKISEVLFDPLRGVARQRGVAGGAI